MTDYNTLMHILRKISLWLTSAVFRFLLLTTAIVGTLVMIVGTPVRVKQTLKDSNVYGTFVDGVISEARKNPVTKSDNSLPIDDPVFQKTIKDAFTPQFLQDTAENVVDGTYLWLTSKTPRPDFKIDISTQKQKFANAIGDYAVVKLNAMPVCTHKQLLELQASGNDIDPFKSTCKPAGLNIPAQKKKVVSDLLTSKDFLSKTVFTADSLPKDQNGDNFFKKLSFVPKVYGWVNLSPIILGVMGLALAAVIIFLQDTRRKGFRSVGMMTAETGVFLGIVSFVSALLYHSASQPGGTIYKALGQNSFQQTISGVLSSFMQQINNRLVIFGLVYVIAGSIILSVLYFTRDKNKSAKETEKPETKSEPSDKTANPEPAKESIKSTEPIKTK